MDAKSIGLKALEIVTGLGAAVAGGYGGPEAAKGVMMAGGAIKDITNEATGDERSRADRHDRADFQAREAVVAKKQEAVVLASEDRATGRAELMKLGWSAEKADLILNGPQSGVTVATLASEPPKAPAQVQPPAQPPPQVASNQAKPPEENSGIAGALGKLLKGATGTRVQEQPGTVSVGAEGTNDSDAYQGTQVLSSIGTLIKGAMAQKA